MVFLCRECIFLARRCGFFSGNSSFLPQSNNLHVFLRPLLISLCLSCDQQRSSLSTGSRTPPPAGARQVNREPSRHRSASAKLHEIAAQMRLACSVFGRIGFCRGVLIGGTRRDACSQQQIVFLTHVEKLLEGLEGFLWKSRGFPIAWMPPTAGFKLTGLKGPAINLVPLLQDQRFSMFDSKHTRTQTKKKARRWIIGDWKIYIWMESLAPPPTNSPLLMTTHFMSTSLLRLPFNVVHIHNVTSFISLNTHYIKEKASLCFSLVRTLCSCALNLFPFFDS